MKATLNQVQHRISRKVKDFGKGTQGY